MRFHHFIIMALLSGYTRIAFAKEMKLFGLGKNSQGDECRIEAQIEFDKSVTKAKVVFDKQNKENAYHSFFESLESPSSFCSSDAQFSGKQLKISWVEKLNSGYIPRYLILSFDSKNFNSLEKIQSLDESKTGAESIACLKLSTKEFLLKDTCFFDNSLVQIL